ncbi:MAG: hypothetical protein ACOYXB_15100 [Bacteroidota bacterium]
MKKQFLVLALSFAVFMLNGQDVNSVIQKHLKASGQEKLSKVESIVTSGTISMPSMGMEMSFSLTKARPVLLKLESDFNGSPMIQVFNGTEGWTYAPGLGVPEPVEMGAQEITSARSQAKIDNPFYNFEERGEKAELVGEESFNDKPCFHVKLTSEEGNVVDYFINRDSYLLDGYITSQSINGQDIMLQTSVSDYKKIKGTMQPLTSTVKMNGQVISIMKVNEIKFGAKADPGNFGKPATE